MAIALNQRSSLFEAIHSRSNLPKFYKARSRHLPFACTIPRWPETIRGPRHLHHHHHLDRRRRRRRRRAKRGSGANGLTDRPSIGRSKLISSIDSWSGPEGRREGKTDGGECDSTHVIKNAQGVGNSAKKGVSTEILWKQVRRFEPIEFHYVTMGTGRADRKDAGCAEERKLKGGGDRRN